MLLYIAVRDPKPFNVWGRDIHVGLQTHQDAAVSCPDTLSRRRDWGREHRPDIRYTYVHASRGVVVDEWLDQMIGCRVESAEN